MATMLMNIPVPVSHISSLIPVLVTGIQQRRVRGAEDSFHAKDFAWLDSCDKHRNEGSGDGNAAVAAYLERPKP